MVCHIRSVGVKSTFRSITWCSMRAKCHRCHYPLNTCLCEHIKPVHNQTEVVVLQHSKEAVHAKNTVKLLQLSLQNIHCYTGKVAEDFKSLREALSECDDATVVLYPSPESTELTSTYKLQNCSKIKRLIVIDGSWKQAYGLWKRNPWLDKYPFYRLPDNIDGQYGIRKTQVSSGLSTLEAVAFTLQCIESTDTAPLYQLLDAFKQQWYRFSGN